VKVTLELPDRVWGRLASMADTRNVKVADLIADAVTGILPPPPTHLEQLEHELRQARRNGWRAPRREKSE